MSKKQPTVFVYGYKKLNLGDDLFFSFLFSRYPHVKFIFCGKKEYKKVLKPYRNVKVVTPYSPYDLFCSCVDKLFPRNEGYMVRRCDYKVLITGSGFVEKGKDIFSDLPVPDQRLFVLGSNFGPFSNEAFVSRGRQYFAACREVCFRDEYSYRLFADLPNVRHAPDIVFGSASHGEEVRQADRVSDRPYAVLSVLSFDKRTKDKTVRQRYVEGIRTISEFLISKGLDLVFMSFCDMEHDMDAIQKLMSYQEISSRARVYAYEGNMKEAVSVIAHAQAVVATRFHAMILGFSMGVKTLPIVYNPKMQNVLNDLHYNGLSYTETTVGDAESTDLDAWYGGEQTVALDITAQAEEHFAVLDGVLHDPCPERWML